MEVAAVNDRSSASEDEWDLEKAPLLAAIRKKDAGVTKQLLEAGTDVNGGYPEWELSITATRTVLPAVVAWGDYTLIELIIEMGAEINGVLAGGDRALVTAVAKRDTRLINLLIESGADVNAQGSHQTVLTAAVKTYDLELVCYLLSQGADPDEWALYYAVSYSL